MLVYASDFNMMRFVRINNSKKNESFWDRPGLLQNGAAYGLDFVIFFTKVGFDIFNVKCISIFVCFEGGNVDSDYPLAIWFHNFGLDFYFGTEMLDKIDFGRINVKTYGKCNCSKGGCSGNYNFNYFVSACGARAQIPKKLGSAA